MNPHTTNPQKIETGNPAKESTETGRVFPAADRKPLGFSRPIFVITGLALCIGLGSCIYPSDGYGGSYSTTYRPGYRVNSLPGGYRSENISGNTYYYHDGYYYRPSSGGYVVVDAPRNSRYYDDYNRRQRTYQTTTEYRESPDRHDGRYERGEVITRLPDGYRVVNHRGDTYYQAGDRYYRRQGDVYVISTRPY